MLKRLSSRQPAAKPYNWQPVPPPWKMPGSELQTFIHVEHGQYFVCRHRTIDDKPGFETATNWKQLEPVAQDYIATFHDAPDSEDRTVHHYPCPVDIDTFAQWEEQQDVGQHDAGRQLRRGAARPQLALRDEL